MQPCARVLRLPRAAIEEADGRGIGDAALELGADMAVNGGDVGGGRRAPGADRPDRLIGDDQLRRLHAIGERARELARPHPERPPRIALRRRLADAEDGDQTGLAPALHPRADARAALVMAAPWPARSETALRGT